MRKLIAIALAAALLPRFAGGPGEKYVALTFDDGPSGKYTRQLLDGLYDRGVSATFFLCGYRIQEYPDITQRIFEEGHEIGYHGYSHNSMKGMSRRDIAAELEDTQALLPEGCNPKLLRPPGGNSSDALRQVTEVRGLSILSWSVDPRDWATQDKQAIETTVLTRIQDGDIVLLHDMSLSSVQAALDIVDALLEEDFTFVTVSELARLRGTRLQPGKTYQHFPPEAALSK